MRTVIVVFFLALLASCFATAAEDGKKNVSKEPKSFGQPFDEIVVASSLTVRRKNGARQAKSPTLTRTAQEKARVKRRTPRSAKELFSLMFEV